MSGEVNSDVNGDASSGVTSDSDVNDQETHVTTPVPAPVPPPGPELAFAGAGPEANEALKAPKERRRWSGKRLAVLIGAAVALGAVAGAGLGYGIQAQRPPTPLPPLAGDTLHYPAARAAAPALSASEDDAVRTDGDLVQLLVPPPAGSRPWDVPNTPDGWLSLADFAKGYDQPDSEFRYLLRHGFRRAAEVDWHQSGDQSVSVILLQLQKPHEGDVQTALQDRESYSPEATGGSAVPVPGSSDGEVYPGSKSHSDNSGGSYYQGRGYARHGDVIVEVYVSGPDAVSGSTVMSVLQSQLERL